ncbi:MAG: hypothetical protein GVX78_03580 [Bacteroidetes bacterium]|jgi:hypothetical protein|nr:hypothetical protein [Bacteroidota bacterium]
MPRVGKVNLRYKEKHGTEHTIWYTQKKKFEIRDLPDEIISMTDFYPSRYATEEALIKDARAACRKYRELIKTRRRVILYKCNASAALRMNKVGHGHYSGTLKGVSKKIRDFNSHSMPLASIGIEWKVCDVVDDGASQEYFEVTDIDTGEVSQFSFRKAREYQVMEFTQERYEFFQGILKAMQGMVRDLSNFFGADPEKAALMIENNQQLLPYKKPKQE